MIAARSTPRGLSIQVWLAAHAGAVALLLVALGLAARLLAARRSFVTSDEMLHLQLASPETLLGTYRGSLSNAHPPLFTLLLHFWMRIVGPGWQLCLLPVAFGTAFLWAAYRWGSTLFGKASALLLLSLLSFLPSLVLLSAELRGYALMLCLVAAALAALERALESRSPRWLGLFAVLSSLALLTHYAAVRFAFAAGVYAAIRLRRDGAPARFVRSWLASEAAVVVVFLFLYATQVASLRGGPLEREAQSEWLRVSYFQSGGETLLRFLSRQTLSLFQFLLASEIAGVVGLVLLITGITWLAVNRRPSAILLAVPFGLAAAGGLLRLYPYGGSRHSIDLALFACAGIAVALSRLTGERLWVAVLFAAALAPAAFALGW